MPDTPAFRNCLAAAVLAISLSVGSIATAQVRFDLPPQSLAEALKEIALQAGINIYFDPPAVKGLTARRLKGQLSPQDAISRLLAGTQLRAIRVDEHTFRIVTAQAERLVQTRTGTAPTATPPHAPSPARGTEKHSNPVQQKPSDPAAPPPDSPRQRSTPKNVTALGEVIVTAEKTSERLINVPISMSVLSSRTLLDLGATQFSDWATVVPGLEFTTAGAGNTQVTIRGVTMGYDVGPTVGIYVDDVPYGSSTIFALNAQFAFDAVPFDLQRIDVLRGPQGTLYGATAMGGLIKYVTTPPDTHSYSGNAQASISDTEHGSINYNVSTAVNLPIRPDKLALRFSGYNTRDGGYIDNVALRDSDVNRSTTSGGRIDLLLTPTAPLSIRITGFLQNINRHGEATASYTYSGATPYGPLSQYRLYREPFDQRFRVVSGTVGYQLTGATVTSISSYQTVHTYYVADISSIYVPILNSLGLGPFSAVGFTNTLETDKFTQEVHVSSDHTNRWLDWLVGGFYTHESSSNQQAFPSQALSGAPLPLETLYDISRPSIYEEYAGFGDLTWHFTPKLDVTGGVRYSTNKQQFSQSGVGPLGFSLPTNHSSQTVTTYLGDARYHIAQNATTYIRYATGYRPGGPNVLTIAGGPRTFQADHLSSYEIGLKADLADKRISIDVDAYDIKWNNIQIQKIVEGFGTYVNAPGGATIQGSELSLTARLTDSFSSALSLAYQHAYMNQSNSDLGAARGEQLPNVPRMAAALDARYTISPVAARPTIGAIVRYADARTVSFDNSLSYPQYRLPPYTTLDLSLDFTFGTVHPQIFVHNVFDRRGQLGVLLPQFGARVALVQPRTVGVSLTTSF